MQTQSRDADLEQAREQVRADEAVVSAGGTRRWKAGKGRAYRRDARRAEENSRLKDNVGVEDGGAQRARFRDQNLRAASIEGVEEGRMGRTGRLRRRATASGRRGRRPRAALAAEVDFQTPTTKI